MRFSIGFVISIWATTAAADLFRWVDPESGSIKYSSYPPPWFGDPQKERRAPKVERIPAGRSAPASKPESATALLEAQRKQMLQSLSVLPSRDDFNRAGSGFKQQLESYQAVSAELDRLDPGGAAARKAESQPLLDKLVEGLKAALSAKPPAVR